MLRREVMLPMNDRRGHLVTLWEQVLMTVPWYRKLFFPMSPPRGFEHGGISFG